jgi:hypothetical protein
MKNNLNLGGGGNSIKIIMKAQAVMFINMSFANH